MEYNLEGYTDRHGFQILRIFLYTHLSTRMNCNVLHSPQKRIDTIFFLLSFALSPHHKQGDNATKTLRATEGERERH